MTHSTSYEKARRKLGMKKSEASRPGALLEKSRSMLGKPMPKHHKREKKEISFKHYKKDEPLKNPDTEHNDKEPDFKNHKEMCKHCKSSSHASHEHKHQKHEKHHKNWIAGAIKKPGALHHELGVKKGSKIPAGKLRAAASKGGLEGKRARLAETLKSFHHKHHKSLSGGKMQGSYGNPQERAFGGGGSKGIQGGQYSSLQGSSPSLQGAGIKFKNRKHAKR